MSVPKWSQVRQETLVPLLHLKASIHRGRVDDVHLVSGDQLVDAVVWLAARIEVLGPVDPRDSHVDVLRVEGAHVVHNGLPLRRDVHFRAVVVIVLNVHARPD